MLATEPAAQDRDVDVGDAGAPLLVSGMPEQRRGVAEVGTDGVR
jgi:hypothetical protein